MGDRILVVKDGYLQQIDSPRTLRAEEPRNVFVAGLSAAPANELSRGHAGGG